MQKGTRPSPVRCLRGRGVLTGVLITALALSACGHPGSDAADDHGPSGATSTDSPRPAVTVTVTPSASATPSDGPALDLTRKPVYVKYDVRGASGYFVTGPAAAAGLIGAPDSFKTFIGATAAKVQKNSTCDTRDTQVGVEVSAVETDGFAVGAVADCGGYQAVWAVVDGKWMQVEATQDSYSCSALQRYDVPSQVVGNSCYDYEDNKAEKYQQS